MPFAPGQSGNPQGRPRENAEVKELARAEGPASILALVRWRDSNEAKASVAAAMALLDRGFGKPVARIEHRVIRGLGDLSEEELSALLASVDDNSGQELVH